MRFFLLQTLLIGLVLSLFGIHPAIGKEFHLISAAADSQQPSASGGSDSYSPIMTPNGDHILFTSAAGNLCLTTNQTAFLSSYAGGLNVFVRNRTNGTTTLLSVNTNGAAFGNADSIGLGISTNGQIALFESAASNLVENDANNVKDIFIRDLVAETTIRVSVSTNGGDANGASRDAVITPDGRYVAFVSAASNLVADDTNGIPDVFVRDLNLGITVLASPGATPVNVTSLSEVPRISDNGRFVAFYSSATNLVPGIGTSGEIYLRDLLLNTTGFASTNARTELNAAFPSTNAISFNPVLSADGRYVAFQTRRLQGSYHPALVLRYDRDTRATQVIHTNSYIPNMPSPDIRNLSMSPDGRFVAFVANVNGTVGTNTCVQVWDANSNTTTVASANMAGELTVGTCDWPSIDPTGRFVAFISSAPGLVTNTLSGLYHVYLRDLFLSTTTLVNVDSSGQGREVLCSVIPQLSSEARFVAFEAFDSALVSDDQNRAYDVFLRDITNGTTAMLSARDVELPSFAGPGTATISPSSVSWTGRYVTFVSSAENLVSNDANTRRDIFVRDLFADTTTLVSVNTNSVSANGTSIEPSISGEGRYVAFTSRASDLAPKGTNKVWDVFVRDLQSPSATLASVSADGISGGNNDSFAPQLSGDGKHLIFRSKASNLATIQSGTNLFLRNLANLSTVALTTAGIEEASMTRDGRFIAYLGNIGFGNRLFIWDTVASARVYTNSSLDIASVSISPNGDYLAYVRNAQLFALNWRTGSNWLVGPMTRPIPGGLHFSGDGRYLTFATTNAQSVLTDNNATFDTFLFDLQTGSKTHVSKQHDGSASGDAASIDPVISYDGRFVAYRSFASNIVQDANSAWPGIVLYDRLAETNSLLSVGVNQFSLSPIFSGNGRFLVFPSLSSDLNSTDHNGGSDVFGFAFLYATVIRGSEGGGPIISWPVMPGENYQVQFKDSVSDPSWEILSGDIVVTGNEASIQDTSLSSDQRIYRVFAF